MNQNGQPQEIADRATIDSTLIANGFVHLRREMLGVIAQAAQIDHELLGVMLGYLHRQRDSAEVRSAPNSAEVGDGIDADIWRLRALDDFVTALDDVAKRIQGRHELRK